MRFEILGCGTSTGVPVPGCECAVCSSQDAKNKRSRTAAKLTTPSGEVILFDAGIDLRMQCLQSRTLRVDGVLFTHSHSDHILGIDDLRGFNFKQRRAIQCYGTDATLREIERVFSYLFQENSGYEGGTLTSLELHRIQCLKPFTLCGEQITPFQLWHGKVPVTGFRVGGVVYATDCKTIPPESKEIMKGAKVLFLDALRYREHKTHFTIDQAVEAAGELGAESTYFVHMSHDVEYHEASRHLPPTMHFAYDGLALDI